MPFLPDAPETTAYVSIGTSVIFHLRLIVIVAGVGLLLGGLFGAVRSPIYSAEARLLVGQSANANSVGPATGLEPAEEALAADYSRLVTSSDVPRSASKDGGTVSASPIPNSTIIQINATSSSSSSAVAVATYAARALVRDVNKIDVGNKATLNALLSQYQSTQEAIAQYNREVTNLQAQIATGGPNVATENVELSQLQAKIDVAQLEANSEEAQYQATYSPVVTEESVVQVTGATVYVGNDRLTYLEIGLVAGFFGGALLGTAIAALDDMKPDLLRRLRSSKPTSR